MIIIGRVAVDILGIHVWIVPLFEGETWSFREPNSECREMLLLSKMFVVVLFGQFTRVTWKNSW